MIKPRDFRFQSSEFLSLLSTTRSMVVLPEGKAKIGFAFYGDNNSTRVFDKLSNTYCYGLRRGRTFTPAGGGAPHYPLMLSMNRGHLWEGRALWGGPNWWIDLRTNEFVRQAGPGVRPEGFFRDLMETNHSKPIAFNECRPLDKMMLEYIQNLFTDEIPRETQSKIVAPQLFTPLNSEKGWVALRPNKQLDEITTQLVNLRRYEVWELSDDLQAPDNGVVVRKDQTYSFVGGPDSFTTQMRNPESIMQDLLMQTFGVTTRVKLYPLLPEGRHDVARGQALWTPLPEQAESPLRRFTLSELTQHPLIELLRQLTLLSLVVEGPDGIQLVPMEYAQSVVEPYVRMDEQFPRVQTILDTFTAHKLDNGVVQLDMLDVPARVSLRRNKALVREAQSIQLPAGYGVPAL